MKAIFSFKSLFILLFLIAKSAFADVPACPIGGSDILPDNYPIEATVISDAQGGSTFVAKYAQAIFNAQPDHPPKIFISGSASTIKLAHGMIDKSAPNLETARNWKAAITHVPVAQPWAWNQDFIQSTFNPKTGQPVFHQIIGYQNGAEDGSETAKLDEFSQHTSIAAIKSAVQRMSSISTGAPIRYTARKNSMLHGGNLEAAPGGICVLGKGHASNKNINVFLNEACSSGNLVTADMRHLTFVTHIDEIFKTIGNPQEKAPCDFAFAIASLDRARDLLSAHPRDKVFNFRVPDSQAALRLAENRGYRTFCEDYTMRKKNGRPQQYKINEESVFSETQLRAFDLIETGLKPTDFLACLQAKNSDLLYEINAKPNVAQLRTAALSSFKRNLLAKVREKTGCSAKVIDAPTVFDEIGSFFPNLANSEYLNGTVISPEPVNDAFRLDIEDQYKSIGLKTTFIDTSFAHAGYGNIHCLTNSFRYCRPTTASAPW